MVVFQQRWMVPSETLRQILPAICGALLTVSFGMMLGWPSLAYPYLVDWSVSPIPITYDQTSLIAGFLMEGNSIGTLFCTTKHVTSKTGVFLAACMQLIGWCTMVGANDIWGLLVARSFVGFGNGFGVPQLKRYIKETCEPKTGDFLINYLPLGVNIGVIAVYIIGVFASYRILAAWSILVPLVCVITFGAIPKKNYDKLDKKVNSQVDVIKQHIQAHNIQRNLEEQAQEVAISNPNKQLSLWQALRHREVRCTLAILMLVIFIQQYTGGPANIVYSQIIFTATGVGIPKICSVIYASFFFIFSLFSLKYAKNFYRRQNLLISCFMTVVATAVMALYFHLKHDLLEMNPYFVWAPLFILIFFNCFHTFGLGTTPGLFIADCAPNNAKNYPNKLQVIHFSMSAVISTKIFQVLFTYYSMSVAYWFFTAVALFGFVFVVLFVPETKPLDDFVWPETNDVKSNNNVSKIDLEKQESTTL